MLVAEAATGPIQRVAASLLIACQRWHLRVAARWHCYPTICSRACGRDVHVPSSVPEIDEHRRDPPGRRQVSQKTEAANDTQSFSSVKRHARRPIRQFRLA